MGISVAKVVVVLVEQPIGLPKPGNCGPPTGLRWRMAAARRVVVIPLVAGLTSPPPGVDHERVAPLKGSWQLIQSGPSKLAHLPDAPEGHVLSKVFGARFAIEKKQIVDAAALELTGGFAAQVRRWGDVFDLRIGR